MLSSFLSRESQRVLSSFGTAYVRCFGSGYLYPYQKKDKCCGGIGKLSGLLILPRTSLLWHIDKGSAGFPIGVSMLPRLAAIVCMATILRSQ